MAGTTMLLVSIAVVIRIFSNSFSNVFQKQITGHGYSAIQVNFLTYALLAFACLPLLVSHFNSIRTNSFWIYSILGGIAGAIGNAFLVKALEKGDLSVLGPINAYKSVVGMLAGFILLRELPGYWGLLGIVLIIAGSYIVLDSPAEPVSRAIFQKKEIQYRLLALILTGIEAVFIKRVMQESSELLAFASWSIFGALFSWILLLVFKTYDKSEIRPWNKAALLKLLLLVFSIGAMQLTTIYTLGQIPVGYALALFQLSIIVTVFLGHRIFNEGNLKRKLIGSLVMIAGSLLIILGK